ncbi:MAG: polymer-forming cytoskeletal protein, partial [Xanthobacteraceae bacterium]
PDSTASTTPTDSNVHHQVKTEESAMFGKSETADSQQDSTSVQPLTRPVVRHSAAANATEATASVSSGMTIVGKVNCDGTIKIFGRIEGELHGSTVVIADGAQMEGDVVAEDLTVGGHVKGTIHAKRVKLIGTADVEGDIYHRALSIEENARFEGSSRREDREGKNVIDATSRVQAKSPTARAGTLNGRSDDAKSDV